MNNHNNHDAVIMFVSTTSVVFSSLVVSKLFWCCISVTVCVKSSDSGSITVVFSDSNVVSVHSFGSFETSVVEYLRVHYEISNKSPQSLIAIHESKNQN